MGFLARFCARQKPTSSANIAKERLQIIIAHERAQRGGPSYLPMLKKELLEVIRKYVHVEPEQVKVNVGKEDNCEVLELNVTLPS